MQDATVYAAAAVLGFVLWRGRGIAGRVKLHGPGWDNLHPEVQKRAMYVLEDAARAGLNVGVFEGWRDEARQRQVMSTGASWVGNWMNSYHPWGLAVDFVFLDAAGNWTWAPAGGDQAWIALGEIIERHGFEWGGRWKSFDGPHAQLPIDRIVDLQAKYISPDRFREHWA